MVGNTLHCCEGRWTCENGEKKWLLDYTLFGKGFMMVVEDSSNLDTGSDHNLFWG